MFSCPVSLLPASASLCATSNGPLFLAPSAVSFVQPPEDKTWVYSPLHYGSESQTLPDGEGEESETVSSMNYTSSTSVYWPAQPSCPLSMAVPVMTIWFPLLSPCNTQHAVQFLHNPGSVWLHVVWQLGTCLLR